jgi:DNA-binding CsgD family transcriptional regulator
MAGEAVERGEGFVLAVTEYVTAVLHNGLGRHDAAFAAASRASEHPSDTISSTRALAELIEAASRLDRPEPARAALARLVEMAEAAATEWALGIAARSRALMSHAEVAEDLYREAIERLATTRMRLELARAHLLYGEWLRREGRRADAREQLRTGDEMFVAMGVGAFAERTERELRATGERVRKRTLETRDDLTAQEAQIGRLARDGVSNGEIGARLFISKHTVEYHLHKVFTKLGISSRHQLEQVLPEEPSRAG